jgi:pyruvate kinase
MIENPMPTRAEVTDVANAVYEQADAIMLSGETTVGKYPLRCIEVLDRIARRTERSGGARYYEQASLTTPRQKIAKSAVVMANELKAEAILVFTFSGNMARHAAWMRPQYSPIYAACEDERAAASLSLTWGVTPLLIAFDRIQPENTLADSLKALHQQQLVQKGNTVVVIGAISTGDQIIDSIQMRQIE